MQLPEEFKEFIKLLNENNVKYLLLGGWAVGYYSNPRATKDIDFIVSVDDSNLKKLKKVFEEFKSPPVDINMLKSDKGYIYIGKSPILIEIISYADGINIIESYKRKNIVEIDDIKINIISKDDLIKNKKSTNRLKDHADAEVLENIKINPSIKTKNILKLKLILANMSGAYGAELKEENSDMKHRKKGKNYNNDIEIIKETILLYNKALKTKDEKDTMLLHKSFKKNPITGELYDSFKYKKSRNKIYNEIEYRFKQLLKNEYSYLINKENKRS